MKERIVENKKYLNQYYIYICIASLNYLNQSNMTAKRLFEMYQVKKMNSRNFV